MRKLLFTLAILVGIVHAYGQGRKEIISNPINSGYFADPTIIKENGTYYIYATIDPWGGQ